MTFPLSEGSGDLDERLARVGAHDGDDSAFEDPGKRSIAAHRSASLRSLISSSETMGLTRW